MKRSLVKLACVVGLAWLSLAAQAQISVGVQIGTPPPWGPSGYAEVRYYYLPDIEAYYDVRDEMFIYYNSGRWVRVHSLPPAYRGYDLYGGPKIVINGYFGSRPYSYYRTHHGRFPKGYRGDVHVYEHRHHPGGGGHGHGKKGGGGGRPRR